MSTFTFPLTLTVESDPAKLPNGLYCTGGPSGGTMAKMDVYISSSNTVNDVRDAILQNLLQKTVDSAVMTSTSPTKSSTTFAPAKITGPNTVQIESGHFTTILTTTIEEIRFRGGPVHDGQELVPGDGYEVVASQTNQTTTSVCCIIS